MSKINPTNYDISYAKVWTSYEHWQHLGLSGERFRKEGSIQEHSIFRPILEMEMDLGPMHAWSKADAKNLPALCEALAGDQYRIGFVYGNYDGGLDLYTRCPTDHLEITIHTTLTPTPATTATTTGASTTNSAVATTVVLV